jgi:protein TonB
MNSALRGQRRGKPLQKFMNRSRAARRLIIGVGVAAAHVFLLYAIGVSSAAPTDPFAQQTRAIRLSDVREMPPPPPDIPEEIPQTTVEKLAETMIETDQPIIEVAVDALPPETTSTQTMSDDDYLPQYKVSNVPVFDRKSIIPVYPPIALRSGIEGTVYLELFIDKDGNVRKIEILKEDPPDRGFGEAAVRAFEGRTCKPAMANGEPVAVRFRYPVRFQIR